MTVHTLLLNDCQKFAFQVDGKKVNLCRSRRHPRIKSKFDWTGSWILSIDDARFEWKRLKAIGAVAI
tara:strand:+ start:45 stop:245 length:201 start_codon:yes stop_codon:yes gene_type:complete